MRPVPYQLYRNSRRLAIRAVIHLCLTATATAAINLFLPWAGSAGDDKSAAMTLLAGLASFLIWCVLVLSTLTFAIFALIETWARIAGVERPGPSPESNEPR